VKIAGRKAKIVVSSDGSGIISHSGGLLLLETVRATGLGRALSAGLQRWRKPRAIHDPGKIVTDLAVSLALGGDCLSDVANASFPAGVVRHLVASDPTVSRLVDALAADPVRALKSIRTARAAARERAWGLAGDAAPGWGGELIPIDLGATIVIAHSDKEQATPTWKKSFGFHPLTASADYGAAGGGEALAVLLREGKAGSNTAADHIETAKLTLGQLPKARRRQVLVRTDSGGGTREFLAWLTGRRLEYSVGFTIGEDLQNAILTFPESGWQAAYDADGQVREGAWVAEFTGLLELTGWPKGDAGHRPPGAPASRRAVAVHRSGRASVHRVRHQPRPRPARRPGTPAPQAGALRGPHP
jgi:hypothetical protein